MKTKFGSNVIATMMLAAWLGACGGGGSVDAAAADTAPDVPPDSGAPPSLRLIAPLSTATVTSQTPTLHWQPVAGATGTHVDICSDRACTNVEQSIDAAGTSGAPATPLVPGVHFWHARPSGGTTFTATWEFWVGARSAVVDTSWGTTPDVNGDGMPDLLVEARFNGTAYVYLGSASGFGDTPTVLPGPGASAYGDSIASAGDVNGDGYTDVVVGLALSSTVAVYLGSATGVATTPTVLTAPEGRYGYSVAGAGDINGDGFGDIIVCAQAGTASVFFGSATGVSSAHTTLIGALGSEFAASVSSVGDVNGDGFADVAVGDPDEPPRADVYLGSASGIGSAPTTTLSGPHDSGFGVSVASAGDVNGDGYSDLIVGTDDNMAAGPGGAAVFLGSASGIGVLPMALTVPAGSTNFGYSVASAGDVNADGFSDLVVGAYGADSAYVYLGSASGVATAFATLTGIAGSTSFGYSVASAGDVNGDGFADVLVGAPAESSMLNDVYVYNGAASGLSTTPTVFTGPMYSEFGWAVANIGGVTPTAVATPCPPSTLNARRAADEHVRRDPDAVSDVLRAS